MDELEVVWRASAGELDRSRTVDFMRVHSIDQYQELVDRSIANIEWFWSSAVEYLGIPFREPFENVLDTSAGIAQARWFEGGITNLSEVCVDRWASTDPDRIALITERNDGS